MLLSNIDLSVYKIDESLGFEALGDLNKFTSLIWPDKYNGFSTFQLWAPITDENKELLKEGNIIWAEGDENAFIVEIVKPTKDEEGKSTIEVKGRSLEAYLTSRIVWNTYSCNNKRASSAIYEIVDQNCINPADEKRIIPFLECDDDESLGDLITYQKTGGEVYEAISGICSEQKLGFKIIFDPYNERLLFKVIKGKNKTINQNQEDPVVLSSEFEDIRSSTYYLNIQDLKTVALVLGEDSGANRKKAISGDDSLSGFSRKELSVDARDLQSEITKESGETEIIPPAEYLKMLVNRGNEKLSECIITESFEASIRVDGSSQYVLGVDYNVGDVITVQDNEIGVTVDATVDEVQREYSDKFSLSITLGYAYPTLMERIRRKFAK